MSTIVLLDQNGPLPVSVQFDAQVDGPVTFFLSGTAWCQDAPTPLAIDLMLDGASIGSEASVFANQSGMHLTLRPTFITFDNLTLGSHTIEIMPSNTDTITDQNDYFQVAMIY